MGDLAKSMWLFVLRRVPSMQCDPCNWNGIVHPQLKLSFIWKLEVPILLILENTWEVFLFLSALELGWKFTDRNWIGWIVHSETQNKPELFVLIPSLSRNLLLPKVEGHLCRVPCCHSESWRFPTSQESKSTWWCLLSLPFTSQEQSGDFVYNMCPSSLLLRFQCS